MYQCAYDLKIDIGGYKASSVIFITVGLFLSDFFFQIPIQEKRKGARTLQLIYTCSQLQKNSQTISNKRPFLQTTYVVKRQRGFFSPSTLKHTSQKKSGIFHNAPTHIFFFLKHSSLETKGFICPHLIMLLMLELTVPRLYFLAADHGGGWGESLLLCFLSAQFSIKMSIRPKDI